MIYSLILISVILIGKNVATNCTIGATGCIAGTEPIGGLCTGDADCVGDPGVTSECLMIGTTGRCSCRFGFTASRTLLDCLPIRHDVGMDCEEEQQCTLGDLGALSSCIDDKCDCPPPDIVKIPEALECVLVATHITDPCQGDGQCWPNLGEDSVCRDNAAGTGKECVCDGSKSVPRHDGTHCLKIANRLGDPCEDKHQCRSGRPGSLSECLNDICMCKSTAVNIPGEHKCLVKLWLGEGHCVHDIQCESNLGTLGRCDVSTGICACRDGGIPNRDGRRCLPLVDVIGGQCEELAQCQLGAPGQYSDCILGTCQCTSDAMKLPGEQICYRKATHVNDQCKADAQCTVNLGDWSTCEQDRCICLPGSLPSTDGTKCLQGPHLIYDPCEDVSQCPANSVCNSQCICRPGYLASRDLTRCLPVIDIIGGTCEEGKQCQQGQPGSHSDCVDHPSESRKICQCSSTGVHIPPSNICFRKATFVGDVCQDTHQCVPNLGPSFCDLIEGTCTCETNYVPSKDNSKCVLRSALGRPCTDDGQCSHIPESASCLPIDDLDPGLGSTCQCSPGFISPDGGSICYRMALEIGDPCEGHDIQCWNLQGAKCYQEVEGGKACHCDYSREVVSGDRKKCLPVRNQLNQTCLEGVQCVIQNSFCAQPEGGERTQCICLIDYVESVETPNTCLETKTELLQPCQETIQCTEHLGNLTECRSGRCDCSHRAYQYNGRCHLRSSLGSHCETDQECFLGARNYSYCDAMDSRCKCLMGAIEWELSCWENKGVGDPCLSDEECEATILGETHCANRICSCMPGYKVDKMSDKLCLSIGSRLAVISVGLILLSLVYLLVI